MKYPISERKSKYKGYTDINHPQLGILNLKPNKMSYYEIVNKKTGKVITMYSTKPENLSKSMKFARKQYGKGYTVRDITIDKKRFKV